MLRFRCTSVRSVVGMGFWGAVAMSVGGVNACSNSYMKDTSKLASSQSASVASTPAPAAQDKYVISTVNVTSDPSNGSAVFSIFFDTQKSTTSLSSHCQTGGSQNSKPCVCQFSWNEQNPSIANNGTIPRRVQTSLTNMQQSLITCNAPDVYATEIPDGTSIQVSLVPAPSSKDVGLFTSTANTVTKSAVSSQGAFQDSQGHLFDNILHYSCYQTFKRGTSILSKAVNQSNATQNNNSTIKIALANQFCVSSATGSTSSSDCPPSAVDFSAQSYYFNLFVRKTEVGDINRYNDNLTCATVAEPLPSNTGGSDHYWPLDSTFALSLGATANFTVGVEAYTKLSISTDSAVAGSSCFPGQGGASSSQAGSGGLIRSCLGFAAPVNPDGTCPVMKDANNNSTKLFRLRRYFGPYPRLFDTGGAPLGSVGQAVDTIYVLDRPVNGPNNTTYTMLGPKPCPFAFYDSKAVARSPASYVSVSDFAWEGKNYDGIEFPNFDFMPAANSAQAPSCSMALPIFEPANNRFTLKTIHKNNAAPYNHQYVRPVHPFLTHYEEDTEFQACAPQANPLVDPPLHFARDSTTGNVGWCAEVYPSRNPGLPASTAHPVKNSASAAGTQTRSVVTQGPGWRGYPLGSADVDVEGVLLSDFSYQCKMTYDNNSTSASKVNKSSPSDGCCNLGIVQVQTGTPTSISPSTAHLESDRSCGIPNY